MFGQQHGSQQGYEMSIAHQAEQRALAGQYRLARLTHGAPRPSLCARLGALLRHTPVLSWRARAHSATRVDARTGR